jgi:hypothetical protein
VPFGSITHAELDAEVDAEPDEQRGKSDRDQIQCPDHPQSERCGGHEPNGDRQPHSENDTSRAQSEPENDQNRNNGQCGVEPRTLFKAGELVVINRHLARQTHPRLVSVTEVEVADGLLDGFGRGMPRSERRKI